MTTRSLLQAMINSSEKAANIARACREENELFKLLVQEKQNDEKNTRFLQDFKTLADVLIQETTKHDLGKQFPEIAEYIKGEESNTFTNTLGETVAVQVLEDEKETSGLLYKVLNGNENAANILSKNVHQSVDIETNLQNSELMKDFPLSDIGIWIDPIDSTAEYISGSACQPDKHGIYMYGLRCVTVLIGAYLRTTGQPIMGVINQPFHMEFDSGWKGQHFWGVCYNNTCVASFKRNTGPKDIVLISASEAEDLKARLKEGYELVEAAGAGYKQLCVASGKVDAYVLSRGTTFRWDSCAPHAVLRSIGGGVISYNSVLKSMPQLPVNLEEQFGVKYNDDGSCSLCNHEGIIAYTNHDCLSKLLATLNK